MIRQDEIQRFTAVPCGLSLADRDSCAATGVLENQLLKPGARIARKLVAALHCRFSRHRLIAVRHFRFTLDAVSTWGREWRIGQV